MRHHWRLLLELDRADQLLQDAHHFSADTLISYFIALRDRPDRTAVLRNSEVPVLFVVGTEDMGAPMKDLLQQVHLPEISYLHILENTGHIGMWEATDEINQALLQFIRPFINNTRFTSRLRIDD